MRNFLSRFVYILYDLSSSSKSASTILSSPEPYFPVLDFRLSAGKNILYATYISRRITMIRRISRKNTIILSILKATRFFPEKNTPGNRSSDTLNIVSFTSLEKGY